MFFKIIDYQSVETWLRDHLFRHFIFVVIITVCLPPPPPLSLSLSQLHWNGGFTDLTLNAQL